jgi:integrase
MSRRHRHKLTALEASRLVRPGRHADGGGLYLVIDGEGRRRWVFIFSVAGRRREMGLGAASGPDAVSLAGARTSADAARALKDTGIDPLDHRDNARRSAATGQLARSMVPTFGQFADSYVDQHRSAWKNEKHVAQWAMTLKEYCEPIRHRRIDEIDTSAVLEVLQPIWLTIPETAQRLRARIERVLSAARVKGLRVGENPAAWRDHLKEILPRRQKLTRGHHAALPFDQMPAFMLALRAQEAVAARLLEFTILTATRSGEARGVQVQEIDFEKALWAIPPGRMKAGREHRVPLSKPALELLKDRAKVVASGHMFPGLRGGALSDMAMANVLRRMGCDFTVHGCRSSFRDWAAEATAFPHEVAEMALAHVIPNKAEAAYRRGDLLDKRRALMAAWAEYLADGQTARVVPLRVVDAA